MVGKRITVLVLAVVSIFIIQGCKPKQSAIKVLPQAKTSYQTISDSKKKALIIAIGHYYKETLWKDIHSLSDTGIMKESLGRQGFNQFMILCDSQATKEGILKAFEEFSKWLNPNDVAVVHISSHGQQIEDDNNEEADRLDEAIACANSPMLPNKGYKGELHLRDDELGIELAKLSAKLGSGGDLLVLLDACYSGTGTRGPGSFRGGAKPIVSEGFELDTEDETVGLNSSATRGSSNSSAPMTVISASKANQKNKEYKDSCGSLSLAFYKASQKLSPRSTYQAFFSELQREMAVLIPYQIPTMEGESNRYVFGGRARDQEAFYSIEQLFGNDLKLNAGSMMGLVKGSIIEVHKAGAERPSAETLVSKGKVYWADQFSARAELEVDIGKDRYAYWVFAKKKKFGDLNVGLSLLAIDDATERKALENILTTSPLVELRDSDNELYLISSEGGYALHWVKDSSLFRKGLKAADLSQALDYHVQGQYLKALEFTYSEFNMELSFIPVIAEKINGKWLVKDSLSISSFMHQGLPSFKPGDRAILRVKNKCDYSLYFNMIYLDPNGEFTLYIPKKKRSGVWDEYMVKAHDSLDISYMLTFGEPSKGIEMFKLFASSEPLNFGPIFSGSMSRGSINSELDQLFYKVNSMTRGEEPKFIDTQSKATTTTLSFQVLP